MSAPLLLLLLLFCVEVESKRRSGVGRRTGEYWGESRSSDWSLMFDEQLDLREKACVGRRTLEERKEEAVESWAEEYEESVAVLCGGEGLGGREASPPSFSRLTSSPRALIPYCMTRKNRLIVFDHQVSSDLFTEWQQVAVRPRAENWKQADAESGV